VSKMKAGIVLFFVEMQSCGGGQNLSSPSSNIQPKRSSSQRRIVGPEKFETSWETNDIDQQFHGSFLLGRGL
jgi:hypothetical protein